ncbi:MAG: GIY-YIG nuclease family protein [Alphaproteobacteria bacterium]|nr:MAG: GIY-YIG nuclease family protein [Alphaproteobacteria bacterium]
MAAKAAIHELPPQHITTIVRDSETANTQPYRPIKGNKALEIPPLSYNPDEQTGWVYILASKPNGILYIGQTTNLPQRIHQHKQGAIEGFSKRYGCKTLVYFQGYALITESITHETAMKNWKREWKIRRILQTNPSWRDLYPEICQTAS